MAKGHKGYDFGQSITIALLYEYIQDIQAENVPLLFPVYESKWRFKRATADTRICLPVLHIPPFIAV